MGKMVYLMGKSSTGKDTVYKQLLKNPFLQLKKIVPYTTRPIRAGETEGEEYFFTDERGFENLKAQGKVIEDRAYHTYHGLWRYFTVDDGNIDLENNNYSISDYYIMFPGENIFPKLSDTEYVYNGENRDFSFELCDNSYFDV